jgi:hypothetical protein
MPVLDFDKFKEDFSLHNHRPRVFSWPFFGTLIFSAGLFILYKLNQYIDPWQSWRQALGNATNFCEMNRFDQLIVQPSNTWSNLGYIIVGLMFISIAKNDHKYEHRHHVNNLLAKFPGLLLSHWIFCVIHGFWKFYVSCNIDFFLSETGSNRYVFLIYFFSGLCFI